MIYQYIKDIDNNDRFIYLVVLFCTILLIKRINPGKNIIIALVVAVLIIYYVNDKDHTTGANYITTMRNKLASKELTDTKYFYLDSELVDLVYDIKEYRLYNPFVYRKLVGIIDSFLNLVSDMEKDTTRMGELFQIAEQKKYSALNALHSMIHSIPRTPTTTVKYQHALTRLETLLNNHLDTIYQYTVYSYGKKPINIETKFIYKNHPKAVNESIDNHYDYY